VKRDARLLWGSQVELRNECAHGIEPDHDRACATIGCERHWKVRKEWPCDRELLMLVNTKGRSANSHGEGTPIDRPNHQYLDQLLGHANNAGPELDLDSSRVTRQNRSSYGLKPRQRKQIVHITVVSELSRHGEFTRFA